MQAIISQNKRAFLYQGPLELDQLSQFIKQQFPRILEAKVICTTPKGEKVEIKSDQDLNELQKMNLGQNFVKLEVQGERRRHKNKGEELETPMHPLKNKKSPIERKTHVLSKVYGGEPEKYVKFVEANLEKNIGQTIKKFAEENGLEVK